MKPNEATITLIKSFEGCKLTAYKDIVGVWTIGYGLTTGAIQGVNVRGGMTITQAQADAYLGDVLTSFGDSILERMTRLPTDNQFGAMLSLAYNVGVGAFSKSTCLRRFNDGDLEGAAEALTWFNKAGGKVVRGLVRRREAERDLFLGEAAPTIAVRPDAPREVHKSKTNWATAGAGVTMLAGASDDAKALIGNVSETFGLDPKFLLLGVGIAFLGWIFRERLKKLAQGI